MDWGGCAVVLYGAHDRPEEKRSRRVTPPLAWKLQYNFSPHLRASEIIKKGSQHLLAARHFKHIGSGKLP